MCELGEIPSSRGLDGGDLGLRREDDEEFWAHCTMNEWAVLTTSGLYSIVYVDDSMENGIEDSATGRSQFSEYTDKYTSVPR